ncbi:MAG: hypothetical protein KAV45_02580 [Calditrichia bacterium]|nr:hypothetical protein [Calditrichia bacterium]
MLENTSKLIQSIEELLGKFDSVESSWHKNTMDGWFQDTVGYETLTTGILNLTKHIYGYGHPNFQRIINSLNDVSLHSLKQMKGVLIGTKFDIEKGYLDSLESKIIIEIQTNFLSTAAEFAENGSKDQAAILACTVLEDSLKRLAQKNNLTDLLSKEMRVVADGLFEKNIIEKSTLSSILGFRNLRNAAFHAQWDEVSLESVNLLLVFLNTFIDRYKI